MPPVGVMAEGASTPPPKSYSVASSASNRSHFSLMFEDLQQFDETLNGVHPKEFITKPALKYVSVQVEK